MPAGGPAGICRFRRKKWAKLLKEQINALRGTLNNAVDVALSGRMATSGLMSEVGNVDGAMSLAHAITTHAVEADIDWFTAVDDLKETTGAAHLGTQEFSSGVFYRYASLNLSQLQQNLGGASREQALTIAAHLVHMLATEILGAKQHSFAAFNPADLVMVNFSDFPFRWRTPLNSRWWRKGTAFCNLRWRRLMITGRALLPATALMAPPRNSTWQRARCLLACSVWRGWQH